MGRHNIFAIKPFSRLSLAQLLAVFGVFLLMLTSACTPIPISTDIPHELYTEMVKTVMVQLTHNAGLTPSSTPTETARPTSTPSATPLPTPTVPSSTPTWIYRQAGNITAPILVYYGVSSSQAEAGSPTTQSGQSVYVETFRQQLLVLQENGYVSIPISTLLTAIIFGTELPSRPMVITFDSTGEEIYLVAFEIMKDTGFVGNIFITVNDLDQEGKLSSEQVKEMMAAGWEIGSRGLTGRDLTVDYSFLSDEISKSRTTLEEKLAIPIKYFAYPNGRTDNVIITRVSSWGYEAAFGLTWYDNSQHGVDNLFYLSRIEVTNGEPLDSIFSNLPWRPDILPTDVPIP